jgi:ABC-type multidrug transport system fused ATPase/permease subunit
LDRNDYSLWQTMKRLRKYINNEYCISLFIFASAAGSLIEILMAKPLKNMTDMMLNGQNNKLPGELVYIAMLLPLGAVIKYLGKYLTARFSVGSIENLRMKLANHAAKLPIQRLEGEGSSDIVACLTNDMPLVQGFFENTLPNLISQPVLFMSIFIYLLFMNYQLLLFSMISIPGIIVLNIILGNAIARNRGQLQQHWAGINSLLADSLSGIGVIKAYNLYKEMYSKYNRSMNEVLQKSMQIELRISWLTPFSVVVKVVPRVMCIAFGGYLVIQGKLTTGSLLAFIYLFGFIITPASAIPQLITELLTARQILSRIFSVLDIPAERVEKATSEFIACTQCDPVVEFKDVTFSYNDKSITLDSVTMEIPRGSMAAVVGESGSGKSTLFKLLCGFYQTREGSVKLLGQEITPENLANIREQISILTQDIFLFPVSIYENIALAKQSASKDEIIAAAKAVNIHDFITELPEGYDTVIGEKGCNLSGGQKQRICIARTILKNSSVILFDEPTASLDTESEEFIKSLIGNFVKEDKTVIVIAHRLSTVRKADMVFVMRNGIIVETGSHDELMKSDGYYRKLNLNQLSLSN